MAIGLSKRLDAKLAARGAVHWRRLPIRRRFHQRHR
jgi:hypothetical protein